MSGRKIADLLANRQRRSRRSDGDGGKVLRKLMSHANAQDRWTQVLRSLLPMDQASHFSVANVRGKRMTIHASDAAWATRLRFDSARLLERLHDLQDFSHISEIRVRALPESPVAARSTDTRRELPRREPPPEAPLHELADHTEYVELKDAILRLARHASTRSSGPSDTTADEGNDSR